MTLWLSFAALLVATLAAALWPLLRPRAKHVSRADYDIEVYADQLRELDRDLERGLIDAAQAEAARLEIERRLLAASRATAKQSGPATARTRIVLAAVLAIAIGGATTALYLDVGSPGLPNQPFAQRQAPSESPQAAEARSRLAAVEARLATEPDNADVWRDLGNLRLAAGDEEGAVAALEQAMILSGGRADIAAAYAEALTFAAQGMVTPQAQQLFSQVLDQDSGDPRARFYVALADYQAGRREDALDQWAALAQDAPAGALWLPTVLDRIERAAAELGVDAADYLPQRRGPSAEDLAAAENMTPEQQEEFIRSMVARLAERLEGSPGDVEGWRRLAQSYEVLGEPARAEQAYVRALAIEPDHPETLLRAGLAAARAQDNAAARERFERLQALLPENSDAHRLVSEAITRLDKADAENQRPGRP